MLAWADDLGRPWFLAVDLFGDYWRGARRYLGSEELLAGTADIRFLHGLLDAVEQGSLDEIRGEQLAGWAQDDPRGANEGIERFWKRAADARLIAHAARRADWTGLRAALPALRRSLRRAVPTRPGALLPHLALTAARKLRPAARVAFLGRQDGLRTTVMNQVARDFAPLGVEVFEEGAAEGRRAGLQIVFDAPPGAVRDSGEVAGIPRGEQLPGMVAQAERAILRWLEGRLERRYPGAMVGDNPPAARILQFAARRPLLHFVQAFFHCEIACRLPSPLLTPIPYGIVIDAESRIGSRVTVMNQVTISAAVIEDNVVIGPGARIIGPLTIGRGATVSPNAVVTEDVASHSTVGDRSHDARVVEKRQQIHEAS